MAAGPALLPPLWLLGAVELFGLGVAIVVCLNSISSAGLQCRYAESKFTRPSLPPSLAAAAAAAASLKTATSGRKISASRPFNGFKGAGLPRVFFSGVLGYVRLYLRGDVNKNKHPAKAKLSEQAGSASQGA